MTLVELSVSMALLGVVSVIFLSVLTSVQKGVEAQSSRSQSNDQARLGIEELDHEMNADRRDPGNQCVQWRIRDGVLENRYWATIWRQDPSLYVTTWAIIADHVLNMSVNPQVPAFTLDPDPAKGGRTIVVTLVVNESSASGSNVSIQESVTGRNTEFGYPADVCEDIPPY